MGEAEHWGRRPRDWAELAEPGNRPLFETVLGLVGAGAGRSVLDLGCGSGVAAQLAVGRGAIVTGLDITPELLAIARERVPSATFVLGEIDRLPFEDMSFDIVVAFSALQFARDPAGAAREAARVVRPGGTVAAAGFAEPERNESTALHLALEPLRATAPGRAPHLPYGLSGPDGLRRLLSDAGLDLVRTGEVALEWAHATAAEAVRAVLASGGGAMAIEAAGEAAARAALERAVIAFCRPDGRVVMHNVFRYAIACRAGGA